MTRFVKIGLAAVALVCVALSSVIIKNSLLDRGEAAFKREAYTEALLYLKPLAWVGDETSQRLLSLRYAYGLGLEADNGNALDWLRRAVREKSQDDRDVDIARTAIDIAESFASGVGNASAVDRERAQFWLDVARDSGAADSEALARVSERITETN